MIYRRLVMWLMSTKLWSASLRHVIPFIRFSCYYPGIRGTAFKAGYDVLFPGDIILTVDYKKLTTFLIPGTFAHAALCLQASDYYNEDPEIAEMTHTDYTQSDFFDLCKEADRVVILRCVDWPDAYFWAVIEKAKSFSKCKYDQQFTLGVEALYCSELIYQADFERRLKCDLSDFAGLGREYLSPDGILFAKNIKVIWDSSSQLDGLTGPECETLLCNNVKEP